MDFLTDFGIKPILLIAQIVNFAILLFILKRFMYKPLLKVLDERKQKITKSLKDADEIEERLKKIEQDRDEKLKETALEVKGILKEAAENADTIIAAAHDKAGKDIEKLMEKSKQSLELEKEKLHQEIRGEMADLIALGLQKVAGKIITEKDKKDLLDKSIKEII